jgi:hypothetical protein
MTGILRNPPESTGMRPDSAGIRPDSAGIAGFLPELRPILFQFNIYYYYFIYYNTLLIY